MRLYIGQIYRGMSFNPYRDLPFRVRFFKDYKPTKFYEGHTPQEVIDKVKEDHQVWGTDYLDYIEPENALEYMLMREVLSARGLTEEEIDDHLPTKKEMT